MSKAGDDKKRERLIKKASKELCTDPDLQSPAKRRQWYSGVDRLLTELRRRKDSK